MHARRTLSASSLLMAVLAAAPACSQRTTPPGPAQTVPIGEPGDGLEKIQAQTPAPDVPETPGAIAMPPRSEPPVPGLVRADADTVALTLGAGRTLLVHDFDFNGEPVPSDKIHLHLLSPGVYELFSVAWTVGYWHLSIADAGSFYGLGARSDTLDHAHTVVRNLALDVPAPRGSTTASPVPFYVSSTGYGLWLDTGGEATFDLNATSPDEVTIDAAGARLRVVLFTGAEGSGRLPDVLQAFTALAGHPAPLPPWWAFFPWQTATDALTDATKTRSLGLPGSVLMLDRHVLAETDAAGTSKGARDLGFRRVLPVSAWVPAREATVSPRPTDVAKAATIPVPQAASSTYAEAAAQGLFVRSPNGLPYAGPRGSALDCTNPNARRWRQETLRAAVATGADGFFDTDEALHFAGHAGEDPVAFYDHTDQRVLRNRQGTLDAGTVAEVLAHDLHGDGVQLVRSVTSGVPGPALLAVGELMLTPEGLSSSLMAALSAGLSGLPTGGFMLPAPEADPALFARAVELAAFSPLMLVHDPTQLTGASLALYRRYAMLHAGLFPYRYAAAQTAVSTGLPVMRALVLDDPAAGAVHDEYLFGPDLLVAPVLDRNTSRPVHVPAGTWLDYVSGTATTGPAELIAQAPADSIPVYVRSGTILPMLPDDVLTGAPNAGKDAHPIDTRRVYELIGPAPPSPVIRTDFEGRTITREGNTLTLKGTSSARVLVRWRFGKPSGVTLNGQPLGLQADRNGLPTIEFDLKGDAVVAFQ